MKKYSTKVFLLLSIVIVLTLAIALTACSERDEGTLFIVASDTHVVANSMITEETYQKYEKEDKLEHLSNAIFESLVDQAIKKDAKYMLLCGDLSEYGDKASHEAVASALKRAEDKGIDVFVINGNHDIALSPSQIGKKITHQQFREIYADFGYDKAVNTFEGTLSYVADINETYRLIAIDDIAYYTDSEGKDYKKSISDEHRLWIYDQVDECNNLGKEPIIITHIPFMTHFPNLSELFMDDKSNEAQYKQIVEYMTKKGVNYVFVGHEHLTDVATNVIETDDGTKTLYEVQTGCAAYVNNPYRTVRFKNETVEIKVESVEDIDNDYYADAVPNDVKDDIDDDGLTLYTENFVTNYIMNMVKSVTKKGGLLDINASGELGALIDLIKTEVIDVIIEAPYYQKDEVEGGVESLERVLAKYGVDIPKTNYKNFTELAAYAVIAISKGGENHTKEYMDMIKYTLYWVIDYVGELSDEINEMFPDEYPTVSIDKRRLYASEELECYDSNVVPFLIEFAKDFVVNELSPGTIRDMITNLLNGDLSKNFDLIRNNSIVLSMLNSFTDDKLDGLIPTYVYSKHIDMGGLIDEGLFNGVVKDFVMDEGKDDKEIVINYSSLFIPKEIEEEETEG